MTRGLFNGWGPRDDDTTDMREIVSLSPWIEASAPKG